MNKKLSLKANKLVDKISTFVAQNSSDDHEKYLYLDHLNTVIFNIERIQKEFESAIFFLITAGAIKSGKSTLINLLAHREVSTTKQGKETTLRPAIISAGVENTIILFNTSKSDIDGTLTLKVNDLAIDYIKGFITKEELLKKHKVKVSEKSLTSVNLEKYLTSNFIEGEDEPKLINIQVKIDPQYKNSLLNNNIVIIDTPGIDGIIAGAEGKKDSEQKLALMERVDLMLFLQSSITPINKESKEYILNLSKEHSITNMSLVHNKFTLKQWREKLDIESHNISDEQAIDAAKNLFKDIVKDIKTHIVDFAQAEDGYEYDKKELINESNFEEFEQALFDNIMLNRQELQEERVCNSLQKLIDENINEQDSYITLKTIKQKMLTQEKLWEEEDAQFISKIELLQTFFYNNQEVLRLINESKENGQESYNGWELNETLKYVASENYPSKIMPFTQGDNQEKILSTIKNIVEEENKDLKNNLNNISVFNNFIKNYPLEPTQSIINSIDAFNKLRVDIQIVPFELEIDMEKNCANICIDVEKIYNNSKGFLDHMPFTKLSQDKIDKLIKDTRDAIRKSAKNLVQTFKENLHEDIKNQFHAYYKYLEAKKVEAVEVLSKKRKNKMEQLQNSKELVQKIEDFFSELQEDI